MINMALNKKELISQLRKLPKNSEVLINMASSDPLLDITDDIVKIVKIIKDGRKIILSNNNYKEKDKTET